MTVQPYGLNVSFITGARKWPSFPLFAPQTGVHTVGKTAETTSCPQGLGTAPSNQQVTGLGNCVSPLSTFCGQPSAGLPAAIAARGCPPAVHRNTAVVPRLSTDSSTVWPRSSESVKGGLVRPWTAWGQPGGSLGINWGQQGVLLGTACGAIPGVHSRAPVIHRLRTTPKWTKNGL